MPLSQELSARVRQMYRDGVAVKQISKECRVSQYAVYRSVDADGDSNLEPLPRRLPKGRSRGRRRRLTGDRVALVRGLWRTAEAQVRDIEERLKLDQQPPDERERDARMLAVLVKTLRELSALDQAKAPPGTEDDDDR